MVIGFDNIPEDLLEYTLTVQIVQSEMVCVGMC